MPVKYASGSGSLGAATNTSQAIDSGLLAWAYDPANASSGTAGASGTLVLVRVAIRSSFTVASAAIGIFVAGTGGAMANCFVGVYDAAGTLRGKSADQAAAWATIGGKIHAVTAEAGQSLGFTPQDVYLWVAALIGTQASTPAQFSRGSSTTTGNFALTGSTSPPARSVSKAAVGSAMPATIDLSTFTVGSIVWGGVG